MCRGRSDGVSSFNRGIYSGGWGAAPLEIYKDDQLPIDGIGLRGEESHAPAGRLLLIFFFALRIAVHVL